MANTPLFARVERAELSELMAQLHSRRFAAGTTIISAEQVGEAVYVLMEGTVKIYVSREDGSEVVLALLGPGDVVGEMSLVDSAGRSANVVAREPCSFLSMSQDAFRRALAKSVRLSNNLLQILSHRLRLADEQILSLSSLDVNGRVARQLLAFARRYDVGGGQQGVRIPLRLPQSDLAALVGASRERVNRFIVSLKSQGVVSVDSRLRITVHDRDALARYCR